MHVNAKHVPLKPISKYAHLDPIGFSEGYYCVDICGHMWTLNAHIGLSIQSTPSRNPYKSSLEHIRTYWNRPCHSDHSVPLIIDKIWQAQYHYQDQPLDFPAWILFSAMCSLTSQPAWGAFVHLGIAQNKETQHISASSLSTFVHQFHPI